MKNMNDNLGIITLLPIILTLAIVIIKKDVFLSLLIGIIVGFLVIIVGENSVDSILDIFVSISTNTSTIKTTLFILFIGGLINAIEKSKGVEGFVYYLTEKSKIVKNKYVAQLLIQLVGAVLFVDATSSIIVTSLIGKSFSKKYNIPKEKVAIIANTMGAPIAWFIPFSGAGALVASMLSDIDGLKGGTFSYVIAALPFQFYTIAIVIVVLISNIFNLEFGQIKKRTSNSKINSSKHIEYIKAVNAQNPMNMLFPIMTLLIIIFTIMFVTGNGNIMRGDGSSAVFFSSIITMILTGIYYSISKVSNLREYSMWCVSGMKNISKIVLILILSFIFSNILQTLGTANYLADTIAFVPKYLIIPAIFILSVIIAISTGTSSGSVTILIPIAVLVSQNIGVSIPVVLGAIISGAVFGDQNSPISDSVILTSTVTGVDILDHVKTQLPYTLLALSISLILFIIVGI